MSMQPYGGDSQIQVGQTGMGAGDFVPPRIKVVQQMSNEATEKLAEPGDFYNTLFGINYGSSIKFAPIMPFMQRVFITREAQGRKAEADAKLMAAGLPPLPDGDGLMCRSLDMVQGIGDPGILCARCPLSQWEGRTGAPPCSETYNLAALTETGDVVFFGFSRSSAKVGKKMNSMLRLQQGPSGRVRPWQRFWTATTRLERGDKGAFYVPEIRATADEVPAELVLDAEYWAKEFTGVRIDLTEQEASQQQDTTATAEEEPVGERPF